MPCEIDHRNVLREDLAHNLANAVPWSPIEEALHEVRGKPSALQFVLHDHGKLGHERIVFTDKPRYPDGLAGLLLHRYKGHVAVVVEPGELITALDSSSSSTVAKG
jgi:hypothetical protein